MHTPNYSAINATREKAQRNLEDARIQDEVRLAKQIQSKTSCTWTEALKDAYRTLAHGSP